MLMRPTSGQGLWIKAWLFVLAGYALLGRGFAYAFVGEIVLIAGFAVFLTSRRVMVAFSDPVLIIWSIFAFWGFCRTVPYVSKYGFDALRDAALWGYGLFAVVIVAFISSSSQISRLLNTYRKFLRWYLVILPGILTISLMFSESLPKIPWSPGVAIVDLKSPEAAVHLAGAALFLLIFLNPRATTSREAVGMVRLLGIAGWFCAALFVLIRSRGGFVAMVIPITFISALRWSRIGWRVVAFALTGMLLILVVMETNLVTIKSHGREFTVEQIAANVGSLGGQSSNQGGTEDTKAWRLMWWTKIIRYTFAGPYFWTGKGFGVNLATEDGPAEMAGDDSATLRSPHNGSMTVLARMGVPGLVLWLVLNVTFGFRLFRAYRRAVRWRWKFWSGVNLWILLYWLSALINSCFDVYLESPQGGIWFWSMIGFGVVAMRIQGYEARQLSMQSASGGAAQCELSAA